MSQVILLTTFSTKEEAQTFAHALIDRRLAACIQIVGPIVSVFRWEDNIDTAEEYRCEVKTTSALATKIENALADLHPYDVPELVTVPIEHMSAAYENWFTTQVKDE